MPSCKFYMAMKLDDLRHELASRNLPTEGLKQDLAFRLASLDDANDCNPLISYPHRTSASSSITSNEEGMLAKTEDHDIQGTEVRERSPEQSSPFPIDLSLTKVHDHRQGDNERRICNSTKFSIAFTKAVLPILVMVFLSCVLRLYISAEDQEYFSRSIKNGCEFPSSKIKTVMGTFVLECC